LFCSSSRHWTIWMPKHIRISHFHVRIMMHIITLGLKMICPQIRIINIFPVRWQVFYIKSSWNIVLTRKVNLVSIIIHPFDNPKWSINSRHQFELSLAWKSASAKINPNKISRLKLDHFPSFISMLDMLSLSFLLNMRSNLFVEVFHHFCLFNPIHKSPLINWNRHQINRNTRVKPYTTSNGEHFIAPCTLWL
jgi:hypothetical protein